MNIFSVEWKLEIFIGYRIREFLETQKKPIFMSISWQGGCVAPAPAPACCCSIFPELGASTATRAASLAHRAGIYSNVEQQMLKLSNISRYPQSKARLQNDSRNSASHFEQITATPQ